jgi:hypothetical protein
MKQHMAILAQFKNVHEATFRAWETAYPEASPRVTPRKPLDPNEQILSLQVAIKVADLGSVFEGHEVRACRMHVVVDAAQLMRNRPTAASIASAGKCEVGEGPGGGGKCWRPESTSA